MSEQLSPSPKLAVTPIVSTNRQLLAGWLYALLTVLIWSSYFLSLRTGALAGLSKTELLLMRFTLPALFLLPIFVRAIPTFRQTPLLYLLGISVGSGIGFFLLSAYGMANASVIQGSTLIPGSAPLFVTFIAATVFRQRIHKSRRWGLCFIFLGVITLVGHAVSALNLDLLLGQFMLISSALLWAIFTVSVRQAQLRPLQVAALVTVPNGLLIALWCLVNGGVVLTPNLPMSFYVSQLVVQGLFVGVFSGMFYAMAIKRLGAETTSAIGSMTPVFASALAFLILQESLEFLPLLGLSLTAIGVFMSSRTH